jgi:ABC-type multidrug transport system fused ATPase/permease subunit
MFLIDWKMALLALASLPLGALAMRSCTKAAQGKMGNYYASAQKMNKTIVEYINGMEVVKVFNRDGESTTATSTTSKAIGTSRWRGIRSAGRGWPFTTASCPVSPSSCCRWARIL